MMYINGSASDSSQNPKSTPDTSKSRHTSNAFTDPSMSIQDFMSCSFKDDPFSKKWLVSFGWDVQVHNPVYLGNSVGRIGAILK